MYRTEGVYPLFGALKRGKILCGRRAIISERVGFFRNPLVLLCNGEYLCEFACFIEGLVHKGYELAPVCLLAE